MAGQGGVGWPKAFGIHREEGRMRISVLRNGTLHGTEVRTGRAYLSAIARGFAMDAEVRVGDMLTVIEEPLIGAPKSESFRVVKDWHGCRAILKA